MAVSAAIKFTQGMTTDAAGRALIGVLTTPVVASSGDNSNVANWTWEVLDAPVGSAVPIGLVSSGAASTYTFVPDQRGSYLLRLTVQDLAGNTAVDTRTFGVLEITGRLIPPFSAAASALNFSGQIRGWAKYMEQYLHAIDAGGASLTVKDEGAALPGTYSILNFVGAGVTATNAGGGQTNITIPGGGGTPAVVFDTVGAAVNIRSDRAANQGVIDNTKVGITQFGSDTTAAAPGATANYSTIGGGDECSAQSNYATVGGGQGNRVFTGAPHGAVCGGHLNECRDSLSFVGGGDTNKVGTTTAGQGYSTIGGGQQNTIGDGVGWGFIGGGFQNIINAGTGFSSVICGGDTNSVDVNVNAAGILGGDSNVVHDDYGMAGGLQNEASSQATAFGYSNIASGTRSVALGDNNNATDTGAVAIGRACTASANGSAAFNANNTASGVASSTFGEFGNATRRNQHTEGYSAVLGDYQRSRVGLKGTSVAGAAINLADTGAAELALSNQKAYSVRVVCTANRSDAAGRAQFVHTLLVHCSAGTAVIDNDNLDLSVPNGEAWTFAITVTGATLRMTFTGTAGQNVNALAVVEFDEVIGF